MSKRTLPLDRPDVSRDDFVRVVTALEKIALEVERCRRDLDIQFKRTAQVQAEVEELQRALKKLAASKKA